jgi:hypothetical protein
MKLQDAQRRLALVGWLGQRQRDPTVARVSTQGAVSSGGDGRTQRRLHAVVSGDDRARVAAVEGQRRCNARAKTEVGEGALWAQWGGNKHWYKILALVGSHHTFWLTDKCNAT